MAAEIINLRPRIKERDKRRSKAIQPAGKVAVKDVPKRGGVQRAWDFDCPKPAAEAIEASVQSIEASQAAKVIPFRTGSPHEQAYNLYARASLIDEDPAQYDAAERLYREAIAIDPKLAIAYTNLGNVRYRKGEEADAVELYEKAIAIDDRQPEAHYNLGYLRMERGKFGAAIESLRTAVACDSRFADAHFNLAMALEQSGGSTNEDRRAIRTEAHSHWRRYLDLEPEGTWADIARAHLR